MLTLILAAMLNSSPVASAALNATVYLGATQAAAEQRHQRTTELAAWLEEMDREFEAARHPVQVSPFAAADDWDPFADDRKPVPDFAEPVSFWWPKP